MSNYAEKATLDHMFGKSTWGAVTPYLALCTADPTDAGTGSSCNETSGTNYARVAITSLMSAAHATDGTITNGSAIPFATAGAGGWGTVSHFAVCDALTNGNMICYGALGASKAVADGDTVEVPIGDLDASQT